VCNTKSQLHTNVWDWNLYKLLKFCVKYLTCYAVGTDAVADLHGRLLLVGGMKILTILHANSVKCLQIFILCTPRI
jgi:hypothetical protein